MEERKQRKKLQNLLNQRAHRLRLKEQHDLSKEPSWRPYQVLRWRLDHEENTGIASGLPSTHTTKSQSTQSGISQKPSEVEVPETAKVICSCVQRAQQGFEIKHSPSLDHLLTLIQFNVLRGLVGNKAVLEKFVIYLIPSDKPNEQPTPYVDETFPGRAVVIPTSSGIPVNLHPTQFQTSVAHSTWIDVIPFPEMRDNLIKWEAYYDQAELMSDLVGDLLDLSNFPKPRVPGKPNASRELVALDEVDDEPSANRTGLIVWGEPHIRGNWEVTPGFLRKWRWTLEGCQDVIESSNRWRLNRGESLLPRSSDLTGIFPPISFEI